MRLLKTEFLALISLCLVSLSAKAQVATTTKGSAAASTNGSAPTTRVSGATGAGPMTTMKKRVVRGRMTQFVYVNGYYTSFADQVYAKINGGKKKARSVFQGFGAGLDYTRYNVRYLYGWNLNALTGTVDIQKVQNISYPRKSFFGVQTGPEIGYRVNSDMDLSYSLGVLYRDIETIGQSFALSSQVNIKFRFTPKLTFFQNFGNYGNPKAYSYSIGLRWLL